MSEAPSISVEQQGQAVVVRVLARDLGEANLARVRAGIADAVSREPSLPFIVDLSQVKFLPSLTLGALVRLVNEFRSRRQRLIFVCVQATVRQVLAITRIDRIMEVLDDVDAALRGLGATG